MLVILYNMLMSCIFFFVILPNLTTAFFKVYHESKKNPS